MIRVGCRGRGGRCCCGVSGRRPVPARSPQSTRLRSNRRAAAGGGERLSDPSLLVRPAARARFSMQVALKDVIFEAHMLRLEAVNDPSLLVRPAPARARLATFCSSPSQPGNSGSCYPPRPASEQHSDSDPGPGLTGGRCIVRTAHPPPPPRACVDLFTAPPLQDLRWSMQARPRFNPGPAGAGVPALERDHRSSASLAIILFVLRRAGGSRCAPRPVPTRPPSSPPSAAREGLHVPGPPPRWPRRTLASQAPAPAAARAATQWRGLGE